MRVMDKIRKKAMDNDNEGSVTIAFLGDSVTQGCFEIYPNGEEIGVVFDNEHAYHNCLCKILSYYFPTVPINVIKAGISGDSAPHGAMRLEQDVLRFCPDLLIVCFGLNDAAEGLTGINMYTNALEEIFDRSKKANIEVIFMTPNMLNTKISPFLPDGLCKEVGEKMCEIQNSGIMDLYMETAKEVCKKYDVKVCDCYNKWKTLAKLGVDTTALLCNHINHPAREMSWLFASSLFDVMTEE